MSQTPAPAGEQMSDDVLRDLCTPVMEDPFLILISLSTHFPTHVTSVSSRQRRLPAEYRFARKAHDSFSAPVPVTHVQRTAQHCSAAYVYVPSTQKGDTPLSSEFGGWVMSSLMVPLHSGSGTVRGRRRCSSFGASGAVEAASCYIRSSARSDPATMAARVTSTVDRQDQHPSEIAVPLAITSPSLSTRRTSQLHLIHFTDPKVNSRATQTP